MAPHWQIVLTVLMAFGVVGAVLAIRSGRRYGMAALLIVGATAAATVWVATAH